jgi:ubiquinone/menaquinone biosynthesis C-methylase UbiE
MRMRRFLAALFCIPALWLSAQSSPGRHPVSNREYARPMGVAGAAWLDRQEREREEQPSRAIQLMGIEPGMMVADIGAGSGYFTERVAKIVGPKGHVYATDIQRGMLALLEQRIARERLQNVTTILSEPSNPRLPANSIDLAFMVDVYHELGEPQTVLGHLRTALRPGARLILIEYKGEDASIPILPSHKMTVAQAKAELESDGFVLTTVDSSLPRQHVLTFRERD